MRRTSGWRGLLGLLVVAVAWVEAAKSPPHIILIVADDMGWNDVSFHGSDQIPTPNIDALAYNGVILNSHYVAALCSPSRAALLTGKLPIHLGMQHLVILESEPRGLPLGEKLLPQYLRESGYATHAVGKWHQGFHKREYTPTFRGFDSHFGYWNGLQDYYTHEVASSYAAEGFLGFDMRRNMSVARDTRGHYSTDLFTTEAVRLIEEHGASRKERPMFLYLAHLAPHSGNAQEPLQAPDDEVAKFGHVRDPERRIYAATMSRLDRGVGEVLAALRRADMLDNSIVIFMADNGGATQGIHYNRGSNYPLRGIKASAWEGAIRGAAAVWSPLIKKPRRVHDQLMYMADWLPTLLSAAGLSQQHARELGERRIDGLDMWASISGEADRSPRDELLINIDPLFNYSAIRRGDLKYVRGSVGNGDGWYGATGRLEDATVEGVNPTYSPELVLGSPAAVAIAAQLTAAQAAEARRLRGVEADWPIKGASVPSPLSAEEVLKLRTAAEVRCTVPPEQRVECRAREAPCLFDLRQDPCEQRNLAPSRSLELASFEAALLEYSKGALTPANVPGDPQANPKLWRDTWVCWQDSDPMATLVDDVVAGAPETTSAPSGPLVSLVAVLLGLAVLGIFALLALRCNQARRHRVPYQGRFQQVAQADESRVPAKNLDSFTTELRNMPSCKDLARSLE